MTSADPSSAVQREPALAAGFPVPTLEQWERLARAQDPAPGRRLVTALEDGIEVGWVYTAADALASDPGGLPGADPFVRGVRVGQPWAIRQLTRASERRQANAEILEDLEGGATETLLVLARDGAAGIVVRDVDELAEVLAGVALDLVPVALDAGPDAEASARLLLELWRRGGYDATALRGSLRCDPIGAAASAVAVGGVDPGGVDPGAVASAVALTARVRAEFPGVRVLAVDTSTYVEAGAGAVLELAIALATAIAYLRAGEAALIEPAALAAALEFTFVAGPDQFLEIAKLRAARRLWSTVLGHCGVGPQARQSPMYVRTSRRMTSSLDPWNNLLRATTAAFAAAVGGADGITVLPFDEPRGVGTDDAGPLGRRMARNTQLVLIEEASLHRVADPGGGSWYVESLTDQLARAAWSELQAIERGGGIVPALARGEVARRIGAAATLRQEELSRRRRAMTGVNMFPLLGDDGLHRPAGSDDGRDAWAGPPVKRTGGPSGALVAIRDAGGFEELRARAAAHGRSRMVLVNVGPLAAHVNVNRWARSFFEAGGIETVSQPADQIELGGARTVAVCAGAGADPAPTVAALRAAGATRIYLAGASEVDAAAAGADVGVRDGVDMVAVLGELLDRLEGTS